MEKGFWYAVWTLVSVLVGAGVIGLPFVMQKAGFLTGILVLVVVALIMLLVHLYLAEILLRTKTKHQLSGLGGLYLGKYGKHFIFLFNALSIYGALIAYVLGAGQALKDIFVYGNIFYYYIGFFIVFSSVIFFGLNIFKKAEFILNPLKVGIVILLVLLIFKHIKINNLTGFDVRNFLIPYGVLVFAFTGISVIPEMVREVRNKLNLKKAIIYGTLISSLIFILFSLVIVGVAGDKVTGVGTLVLNDLLGFKFGLVGNLFALFAMSTAFVALGFALKENYTLDYNMANWQGWLLVILIPLLLLGFKFGNFIFFLDLTGAIAIGVLLGSILVMHSKAKKLGKRKPEFEFKDNLYLKGMLFILIILGILYVIGGLI